jgi:hypothetical protein
MVSSPSKYPGSSSVDGFVAAYDLDGNYVWSRHVGQQAGYPFATRAALDAEGNIFVVGAFGAVSDFGAGPVTPTTKLDMFLAQYAVEGTLLSFRQYGGNCWEDMTSITVTTGGEIVLSGTLCNDMDFGGGPLKNGSLSLGLWGTPLWAAPSLKRSATIRRKLRPEQKRRRAGRRAALCFQWRQEAHTTFAPTRRLTLIGDAVREGPARSSIARATLAMCDLRNPLGVKALAAELKNAASGCPSRGTRGCGCQ